MARKPRIEFDDAFYHVIARGNQRQRTFQDDQDRSNYIELIDSGPRRGDPLRPRRVSIGISEIYASQPRTLTVPANPWRYRWSSHGAYLRKPASVKIDTQAVLSQLSSRLGAARKAYQRFMEEGVKPGHEEKYYQTLDQRF